MKLYVDQDGSAPSPRRVRMYLAEKKLEVPLVRLALHEENRTREFRRKNPIGTLPVLELDDGTCISESLAICRYFEGLHPEPSLFGRTPLEQAEIEMWTRRAEHYLYLMIDFRGHFARKPETRAAAQEFETWATQFARFLDRELGERAFLTAGRLTMADIFAFGALDYGARFAGFALPAQLERLRSWFDTMAARPSAQA